MEEHCQILSPKRLSSRKIGIYMLFSITTLQFLAFAAWTAYCLSPPIFSTLVHNATFHSYIGSRSPSDPVSPLAPSAQIPSALNTSTNGNITNPLPSTDPDYPSLSKRRIIALAVSLPILVIFICSAGLYWVLKRPSQDSDGPQSSWDQAIGRLESVGERDGPTLADWRGKGGSERDWARRKSSIPTTELIEIAAVPTQEAYSRDEDPGMERVEIPPQRESVDHVSDLNHHEVTISKPLEPQPHTPPDQRLAPPCMGNQSAESTPGNEDFVTAPQSPGSKAGKN